MKLIGVDYGQRRIGIAITDENGEFIRSLPTLDRKTTPQYLDSLCGTAKREQASQIVVGLPLDEDGGETVMSQEIRAFAVRLGRMTGLPVHFVDESLTSKRANVIIRYRKRKYRQNKGNTDKVAACLILEEYMRESQ
jgi:putative Holliday junction resolvase